jgi:hypothetical protein
MTDIPLMRRQIDAQVDEYERAINEYAAFMARWREKNPRPTVMFTDEIETKGVSA